MTSRYLNGIPSDSRAAKPKTFLNEKDVTDDKLAIVNRLNEIARDRGQSLAQMALAWVLREGRVASALIGASRVGQIEENVGALNNLAFSAEEQEIIETVLNNRK